MDFFTDLMKKYIGNVFCGHYSVFGGGIKSVFKRKQLPDYHQIAVHHPDRAALFSKTSSGRAF
jgi:hypothetical protein